MIAGRQRVALVAPYFGRELGGRKERFAFSLATHLALEGIGVEVFTTTARPEASDENFYRAGQDNTEPFPVHRFRIVAPDRVAYSEALLAVEQDPAALATYGRTLVSERLRSPDLEAHVRAVAGRYDAFIFLDACAPTTVTAVGSVAENALLVPLLDDSPVARLPEVAEALGRARTILCTTTAEANLIGEIFGPHVRARVRTIGMAVDSLTVHEADAERVRRRTGDRPYLLLCGAGGRESVPAALARPDVVRLDEFDERDRPALYRCARAVAILGAGFDAVSDVVEAWEYSRPVVVEVRAREAAGLLREVGAGWTVASPDEWATVLAALPGNEVLARMGAAGSAYAEAQGGWRAVARRALEAIDALAALDDGRPRDALLAQIAYLYPLVQRQRRVIEAMRVSRFWRLRDRWFATKRRFGIGPAEDPVQLAVTDQREVELAALGDPYQLFREHHRLRTEDITRMRAMVPLLRDPVRFDVTIDARESVGLRTTIRSLLDQIYPNWTARLTFVDGVGAEQDGELAAFVRQDERIVLEGESVRGGGDVVLALDARDRLEPHALFEVALAFQSGADVVYSDEDRIDDRGVPHDPWFKPDFSPETLLTRDCVGRLCAVRRAFFERAGGAREVMGSAKWYDALLRVSEVTERIVHVPQVLYHRHTANAMLCGDQALAVELALRRRGEDATVRQTPHGVAVMYEVPGDEAVSIVIPTRDRADLLETCLGSIFERSTYGRFEVVVVDNGSKEEATSALFERWRSRERDRFRVLADPAPFNYSRLNNLAVRETTAPYVLFMNNDTEVITPGWIEALLGQARRPRIGAVGALLLYPDDTVQHGGVVLGILGLAGHAHRFQPVNSGGSFGALHLDTNYLAVTGACLLVAREKFEQVGGFDEALAVSYNDVDLCLKLRAAGYRNVVVPRAHLYHYESKSRGADDTPAKVARAMSEVELIRARWPEWSVADPYYNPNLTVDAEDFSLRL